MEARGNAHDCHCKMLLVVRLDHMLCLPGVLMKLDGNGGRVCGYVYTSRIAKIS